MICFLHLICGGFLMLAFIDMPFLCPLSFYKLMLLLENAYYRGEQTKRSPLYPPSLL